MATEKQKELLREVYRVVDEVVSKCGIEDHMTDIYLADPSCFCDDEDWEKVRMSYNLPEHMDSSTPLALIALAILEGYQPVTLDEDPFEDEPPFLEVPNQED